MESVPSSGVLEDSAGDHDASCVGSECPTEIPAVVGNGLAFEGNDVLAVASLATIELQNFTFAMWIRPTFDGFGCVLTRQFSNQTANSFALCVDAAGAATISILTNNLTRTTTAAAAISVGDGFVHLATTWDGTTLRLFIGGIETGVDTFSPALIDYDNHEVAIGADTDAGMRTSLYHGLMDDLRIYQAALSQSEISELATAPN